MKRTKIVCTVGPGTDKFGILEDMMRAGMNVARFNFSHGSHEEQAERMQMVRDAAMIVNKPIALLLDTKGPEVRLGLFKEGKVFLEAGQQFTLTTDDVEGTQDISTVNHKGLVGDVHVGDTVLLADGLVRLTIDAIEGNNIITTVQNSGEIGNRKTICYIEDFINIIDPFSIFNFGDNLNILLFRFQDPTNCYNILSALHKGCSHKVHALLTAKTQI